MSSMLSRWRCLALLGGVLLLSGCGFRPLYGTAEEGGSVAAALQDVTIPEQTTRIGQLIRNEIVSVISPAGTASGDGYVLELDPAASNETAIEAFNTDEIRRTVKLKVAFRLTESATGRVLYTGNTFSQVSYDRVGAPFANLQARTNAEERAAKEIGVDIRTRVAAYFAGR